MVQHLARVADDEHRADRLAFAPFAADLDGQVDHRFQRFQRHARFELPQVAGGQPAEVLVELDVADRVDRVDLEAAVDHDHAGAGRQHLAGHAGQQGLRQLLDDRRIGHVQDDRGQFQLLGPGQLLAGVGSDDDSQPLGPLAQLGPVGRPFQHQQHGAGVRLATQPRRQVDDGREFAVETMELHARGQFERDRGPGNGSSDSRGGGEHGAGGRRRHVTHSAGKRATAAGRNRGVSCSQRPLAIGFAFPRFGPLSRSFATVRWPLSIFMNTHARSLSRFSALSRRMFLGTTSAGGLAAGLASDFAGPAAAGQALGQDRRSRAPPRKPLRLAAINSIFRLRSHAYHIVGRMVHGFQKDGLHHQPQVQVVRMFNDQSPPTT